MNNADIEALQTRINIIAFAQVSPDIVIAPKPEVSLRSITSRLQPNRCSLLAVYNEFRTRVTSSSTVLTMADIAVMLASNTSELTTMRETLMEMGVDVSTLDDLWMHQKDKDITILGTQFMRVHDYVTMLREAAEDTNSIRTIHDIYEGLKGMIALTGKVLPIQAIVGGIAYSYRLNRPLEMFGIISRLEPKGSILHMGEKRFETAITWYREKMNTHILEDRVSYYQEAFQYLRKIPIDDRIQLHEPKLEMERFVVRSIVKLDMVDMISSATLSPDMPIVAVGGIPPIIKVYDQADIEIPWFMGVESGTMKMYVRISKFPVKYHSIEYNAAKNYFSIVREQRELPIDQIMSIICSHLGIDTLKMPTSVGSTYSFITNYIESGQGTILDRNVLAYLITNPPEEYAPFEHTGRTGRRYLPSIRDFVFIKEDNNRPNALKEHINIHIQLGTEKIYLSLSGTKGSNYTTSETIAALSQAEGSLIGFEKKQRFIRVRINKCPNAEYARICRGIYAHVITMYNKYYDEAYRKLYQIMERINSQSLLPYYNRSIIPLHYKEITKKQEYSFVDPILYKYASSIQSDILPVPIRREDVAEAERNNFTVMRLPTVVLGNPSITFETNGEIWVRTPLPGYRFTLIQKGKKGKRRGYIPVMSLNRLRIKGIEVTVNSDRTLINTAENKDYLHYLSEAYPLGAEKSIVDKPGKHAALLHSVRILLAGITTLNFSLMREGLTGNVFGMLNRITGNTAMTLEGIARHAYLCMQENWTQSEDEIRTDILTGRIFWMRHFRALEQAYSINIFFVMNDPIDPHLRKPPHAHFYLHRKANPQWKSIILHSLESERDVFSIIMLPNVSGKKVRGKGPSRQYLFDGAEYLDGLMNTVNNIHVLSRNETGLSNRRLIATTILSQIGSWKAVEQVLDANGKCRAVTYTRNGEYATMEIGFAPVHPGLKLGYIREPSMAIVDDLQGQYPEMDIDLLEQLIMHPNNDSLFRDWSIAEKSARILRTVSHLLYSQTKALIENEEGEEELIPMPLDEFMERIEVQAGVSYDFSRLRHALPKIYGESFDAWTYMVDMLPTMVQKNDEGDFRIVVPSEPTRNALRLFMMATPRIAWPESLPGYLQYTWDIRASPGESVYTREIDLIQAIALRNAKSESSEIITSPIAYILTRNQTKFLVQMARNVPHVRYIVHMWREYGINPGFESVYDENVGEPVPAIESGFTQNPEEIVYTQFSGKYFVIIPLMKEL